LQYQDGDGIEMLSRLKQSHCTVPILLISGYDGRVLESARRIGEAHQLRIAGTLTKPLHVHDLGQILEVYREPEQEEWADELRSAIEAGQFAVYYAAKSHHREWCVSGFEALVRWVHPTRGIIGPDSFIPLAETTGLIIPLTDYVLRQAITDCASWSSIGFELSVAVNIAATVLTAGSRLRHRAAHGRSPCPRLACYLSTTRDRTLRPRGCLIA
jgi:sensor c-di-GMP phosphodiesterase-like protein